MYKKGGGGGGKRRESEALFFLFLKKKLNFFLFSYRKKKKEKKRERERRKIQLEGRLLVNESSITTASSCNLLLDGLFRVSSLSREMLDVSNPVALLVTDGRLETPLSSSLLSTGSSSSCARCR